MQSVGWRQGLRAGFRQWLYHDLPLYDDAASVLDAMVLGQRHGVTRKINEAFVRTGTAHFLAVSGLHVGMLALFVWWVSQMLGADRRAGAVIVMAVVALYVLLAEPRVPILRAGVLCALGCIAIGLRRRTSSLNWLAAGMIVVLVWRPCDLFMPGFQLSFGVVLGIVLLTPALFAVWEGLRGKLRGIPPELDDPPVLWSTRRRLANWLLTRIGQLLAVSIAAWLIGSALVLYHFQRFSPWGWVNSILVWLPAMAIVILGFAKVMLGIVWPQTAPILGAVLAWASRGLVGLVDGLDDLPLVSIECRGPSAWWVGLYLIGLAAIGIAWRRGLSPRRIAVLCLLPLVAVMGWRVGSLRQSAALDLWVLAVGGGQVALLDLPGQGHWLCDAGTLSGFDVGEVIAVPAFRELGVGRIHHAIISHANFDHYGGLLAVADHFPIDRTTVNPCFRHHAHPGGAAKHLLDQLDARGIPLATAKAGDRWEVGRDLTVEVLWPPEDLPVSTPANDCSLVLRIGYAGRSILLCGDIEDEPQRRLIAQGNLKSDVLILPHHGAVGRHTMAFLTAVAPEIIIRSGGRRRVDGSRMFELLKDAAFFDTARDGAVRVTIGEDGRLTADAPFRQTAPGG